MYNVKIYSKISLTLKRSKVKVTKNDFLKITVVKVYRVEFFQISKLLEPISNSFLYKNVHIIIYSKHGH